MVKVKKKVIILARHGCLLRFGMNLSYCVYTMFPAVTAAMFQTTVIKRDKREATQGNGIGKRSRP